MKRSTELLILALALVGFTLSACESETTDDGATDETTEEALVVEEEAEEEAAEEEEQAREYDEDMFNLAAFEVTCVNSEIEDPARSSEIKDEIYARYGFEGAEDFAQAEEQLGQRESVQLAIETRMENCTAELAEGFAEAGYEADGEEAEEEEAGEEQPARAAPAPAPKPPMTGALSGTTSGSDVQNGNFTLQVRNDFAVRGQLRGEREGRAFTIPFSGEVTEQGQINATGDRGGNSITVTGRLTSNSASGDIRGSIFQNDVRVTYQAN